MLRFSVIIISLTYIKSYCCVLLSPSIPRPTVKALDFFTLGEKLELSSF